MSQSNLHPTEQGVDGCPVGGEVGQVPRYQGARGDRRLETPDERIAIDWLDDLVCRLQLQEQAPMLLIMKIELTIELQIS